MWATLLLLVVASCQLHHISGLTVRGVPERGALAEESDMPEWTVEDEQGTMCMLMAMDASAASTVIPRTATADVIPGVCGSTQASFTLKWQDELDHYTIVLTFFTLANGRYRLEEANGTISRGYSVMSWSDSSTDFPSAALGHSMTCQDFNSGNINFSEFRFQPFAQKSNEQYGEAEECSKGVSILQIVIIVAVVLVAVAVVVAGVGLSIACVRKRSHGGEYNIFNN